ncbi:DUF6240 domain-containing protein [Butyrivibrio sp. AC2005]|uniref:DUF6240 domain-containing protein n=1 Tax=Butyrivibrio sp. AC2005 TaxID=1280672 RepID=UPI00040ACC25|nr:DUF6240 domain-containing protein [Butyrivibrio sp. AC2005]
MNVNFQAINGMESDLETSRKGMEAGQIHTTDNIKGITVKGAVAATFNSGLNNQAYQGSARTKSDVMAEAQNTDAAVRHNYMSLMANNMSSEDFTKAAADGFDFSEMDPEETVTILDKIKATLAMSGTEIIGYTDDISMEQLTAITGSRGLANDIANSFHEKDIPVTAENVKEVMTAVEKMSDITEVSDGAVKYMTLNDLQPTMENIYMAEHATNGQDRNGGTFIALETEGYYAQKADRLDWETVKDQAERIIKDAGYDPSDEEVLDSSRWMIEDSIPLTRENIQKVMEIKALPLPMSEKEIVSSAATAISNKNSGVSGYTDEQENNIEKAIEIAEKVDHLSFESIEKVIGEAKVVNIDNLDKAQKIIDAGEYTKKADHTTGEILPLNAEQQKQALTARKQLEEIRLSMTVSANLRLIDKGFKLETKPISDVIEALKNEIEALSKDLFKEDNSEKYLLFEETTQKVSEIKSFPVAFIGQIENVRAEDFESIYETGKNLKHKYEQAGATYEAVGTEVRADLGDNIKKAFRNIDELLKDAGLEANEQNKRAARILGYNRMEISEENIERVRTVDEKLLIVVSKLKPGAVLNMIRDGHNPLKMTLDELGSELSRQDKDSSKQEEKYAKFLYKLEKNAEITPEERESYIGIYRLFHTLKVTDNAAIGNVLETGAEMTIENLLQATRTAKVSKRGIDVKVDDGFGGLEAVDTGSRSISSQIESAFVYYSEKADVVYDNLEPEKLHEANANEEMLLDELAEKLEEVRETEESIKTENQYISEKADNIRKFARTQISGEATEELSRFGIEANIENVQAYLNLKAGRKGREVSVWDRAEKIAKLAFKETRQKMLEDLIDEDDYESSYEENIEELARQLDEMLTYEADTYIDVRSIHLMKKQLSVAAGLARQNSFEIPVEVDGRLVSMHVTLRESLTDGKKMEAELETQDYGHISMAMTINDRTVKGALAASYPNNSELAEYMSEVRERFVNRLKENEPDLEVKSTDIGIFYRRQEAGSAIAGSENGVFENRTLLRMAEIFVQSV